MGHQHSKQYSSNYFHGKLDSFNPYECEILYFILLGNDKSLKKELRESIDHAEYFQFMIEKINKYVPIIKTGLIKDIKETKLSENIEILPLGDYAYTSLFFKYLTAIVNIIIIRDYTNTKLLEMVGKDDLLKFVFDVLLTFQFSDVYARSVKNTADSTAFINYHNYYSSFLKEHIVKCYENKKYMLEYFYELKSVSTLIEADTNINDLKKINLINKLN